MQSTYRNIRTRIIISLLSTIFVVFSSLMFFQNLSAGEGGGKANIPEQTGDPVATTPLPPSETSSSDNPEPEGPAITNSEKYSEQLTAPGSTNVLIAASEPSGWNFDTIMIMNIDKASQTIKFISLPRDLYIDYSDYFRNKIEEAKPGILDSKGIFKINAAPTLGKDIDYKQNVGRFGKPYIDFLSDILEEVFSIHIDDYIYLQVNGVRNIIDYFGGVDINVPILMNYYDPTQNLDIYLEPGFQHLTGKKAEGFLRFRQGYDENGEFHNYGDFYRKDNQNKFVEAFIKQKVTLSNLGKLTNIADVIKRNVVTSVESLDSILAYGSLAEDAVKNNYKMETVELKCDEKKIGGVDYVILNQN